MCGPEGWKEYEGLAVAMATAVWEKWGGSLKDTCSKEDVVQEAFCHLLAILPKVDAAQPPAVRAAYVCVSLRGLLFNWVRKAVYPRLREVPAGLALGSQVDSRRFATDTAAESLIFMSRGRRAFCEALASGATTAQAGKDLGWSRERIKAEVAKLREELEWPGS